MSNSIVGIVKGYSNIDRVHSIEKEREETMSNTKFQEWCKSMNIGSRVESSSGSANDLMAQYTNYTKWISKR